MGYVEKSMVAAGGADCFGNAAGAGAKLALVSPAAREEAGRLARRIKYVELAGWPDFQDVFMAEMGFPGE